MLKAPRLTQEQISEINKVEIIQLIRKKREITKLEISKQLGLSHTTVNTYVQMLMDEGFVEEAGVGASNGGRKPKIVKIIPEAGYSFGANIETGQVHIVLINLLGEELMKRSFTYSIKENFDLVLTTLKTNIDQMIEERKLDRGKIFGVGLAFPGLVDDDALSLEYIPSLNIRKYSLKWLEEEMDLKIFAENEANAAAYAEQLICNTNGNFVYVSIAEGIGTGIIIENCIYKGRQKKAGEFGHMRVSDEPVKCNCGRSGCWARFASKTALLKFYEEYKGERTDSLELLFDQYRRGEKEALMTVEKYTRYLFAGIDTILLSINPDYVVIGGDLGEYAQEVIDYGTKKLHLTEKYYGFETIEIICSGLKGNGALIGAALLPLEEVFNFQKNVI